MRLIFKIKLLLCFLLAIPYYLKAQVTTLPASSLNDLTAFKSVSKNWQVVADVIVDPQKRGKIKTVPGTGVILNTAENSKNIESNIALGDSEIDFDFMVGQGTVSSVFIQGRYKIQLSDSRESAMVNFNDCGGIVYGNGGVPPLTNVSKTPGLWQHLKIKFEAARFNAQGVKIADARFMEVSHNGVLVQQNILVPAVADDAEIKDEKPRGPLVFSGKGVIAFRNIRYKSYGAEKIVLKHISYELYNTKIRTANDIAGKTADGTGEVSELTWRSIPRQDNFGILFKGTIGITTTGTYLFKLATNGGGYLKMAGKEVISNNGSQRDTQEGSGLVELAKGEYPFELLYFKNEQGVYPGLELLAEGPEIQLMSLTTANSTTKREDLKPIFITAGAKAALQRCFVEYNGVKRTFCIAVGDRHATNYMLDLSSGSLLQTWSGAFVDAAEMWTARGEAQYIKPLGSVVKISGKPFLAILKDKEATWPDTVQDLTFKGYQLDDQGLPVYNYTYNKMNIKDVISSEKTGNGLTRHITISDNAGDTGLWSLITEGDDISELGNNLFQVNDKSFYIRIDPKSKAVIKKDPSGHRQLLVAAQANNEKAEITYSIIW